MDQSKNLHNVPTWRPGTQSEDSESGIFAIEDGPFEPVEMPRQWVRPRGAKVAPLRARLRRSW